MLIVAHSGGVENLVHPYLAVVGFLVLNGAVIGYLQRRRARRRTIVDAASAFRLRQELDKRTGPALRWDPSSE
jgi:hypothetical protein